MESLMHFLGPPITSFFGEGVGPIHLSEVYCNGSEQKLTDCQIGNRLIGLNSCDHGNDVGVICQGEYSYVYNNTVVVICIPRF